MNFICQAQIEKSFKPKAIEPPVQKEEEKQVDEQSETESEENKNIVPFRSMFLFTPESL
jgi:hypothetical protein